MIGLRAIVKHILPLFALHCLGSGQAVGSQRSSMLSLAANSRLALAVCGLPRSRNRTMFQPRQQQRMRQRWSRHVWPFQRSTTSTHRWPVAMLKVPYNATLLRLPVTATWAASPAGDQLARKGGVSVTIVASLKRRTVRWRPFKPRCSPLLIAANFEYGVGERNADASSDIPTRAMRGERCRRWPRSAPQPNACKANRRSIRRVDSQSRSVSCRVARVSDSTTVGTSRRADRTFRRRSNASQSFPGDPENARPNCKLCFALPAAFGPARQLISHRPALTTPESASAVARPGCQQRALPKPLAPATSIEIPSFDLLEAKDDTTSRNMLKY